jgi:hypothetical protein
VALEALDAAEDPEAAGALVYPDLAACGLGTEDNFHAGLLEVKSNNALMLWGQST